MSIQLIIPMSGFGERFKRAGYTIPKPLIEIENEPIISHVVKMFPGIESITFICNKDHLENKDFCMRDILLSIYPKSKIIGIESHKKGPVYAVLKSIKHIDLKKPIIVNYCDFNCIWSFQKFKEHIDKSNCDGCIVTYTGFHPHMLGSTNYAYVKKSLEKVVDIQEKKPFTNNPMSEEASSGTYYFRSGEIMKKCFENQISKNLNTNGEFYVSLSYKSMVEEELSVNTYSIDYFMQWGTPEDLAEYNWFSNLFKAKSRNLNHEESTYDGATLIASAGDGSRFAKHGYKKPKPLINVSGKPMLIQAIRDLPSSEDLHIIVRKEFDKDHKIKTFISEEYPNSNVILIDKKTAGQASTCLEGLNNIDMNKPLTISACDTGVIYQYSNLQKLKLDKSIDVIVWGCRGFPGAIKSPEMYGWIDHKNNNIRRISVKRSLGNPKDDFCVIGTFTFNRASDFKSCAEEMIKHNQKVNDEYYVDNCINNALCKGLKVVLLEVDYFLCWGTPNELLTYNYWQSCHDECSVHPYKMKSDIDFSE